MPRSVLVPDVKQLTDHYLRQQRGGNIIGFRGARIQRGYGIGGIFKSLARIIAIPLFKRGAKAVGKRARCKQLQKLVKTYWREKM